MIDPTNHRGIAYLVLGWSLTFIAMLLCTIRMYSRTILTRSVGSDDFAILVALVRANPTFLLTMVNVLLTLVLGFDHCR